MSSAAAENFAVLRFRFSGSEAFAAAQVLPSRQIEAQREELVGEIAPAFRVFELPGRIACQRHNRPGATR
jgi:hypothetical protein